MSSFSHWNENIIFGVFLVHGLCFREDVILKPITTGCREVACTANIPVHMATTSTRSTNNADLNWCGNDRAGDAEAATTEVLLYIQVA